MTLKERLDEQKAKSKERIPAEARTVMGKATRDLAESGLAEHALGSGDTFPEFELLSHQGELVQSRELLVEGPMIVTIYRGVW